MFSIPCHMSRSNTSRYGHSRGQGKGYADNVPLKDEITDESFQSIFELVVGDIGPPIV
ncbi:hypothetical protein EDD18DRAFT_1188329 [Armillaria luteobubalina]|uniref:Uncharacterized protein n=1 Tax=Armillaria luteobubalina TaxID=153913 RepID=A0AA39PTI1_9AGAR|nr:hypothetical protein EDD18DRAFT_1188329 [Armillaria luteobubalina]